MSNFAEDQQATLDLEHLRLLRIGYLISGATNAAWACFPIIHITIGLFMLFGGFPAGPSKPGEPDQRFVGLLFIAIGGIISSMFAIGAALKLLAARRIRERRSKTFCLAVAALSCLGIPYGTALGVFTFVVLARPSVAQLFERRT